jgi:prepilin-type N-terminal cleavage/methylation domain-containing protein
MPYHQQKLQHTKRGFTLIEMMVSVAIFSVVMAVATIALLAMVDASKKAHALQSVMFNLNVAIDGMVRGIRMGTSYELQDLYEAGRGKTFVYCPFGRPACKSAGADANYKVTYKWIDSLVDPNYQRIVKTYLPVGYTSSPPTIPITASEVKITALSFYLTGAGTTDYIQPRMMVIIRGTAGTEKVKTTTNFDIQASATQRLIDI